jgi:hypothetical protein
MTKSEVMNKLLAMQEGKHLGDLCGWSLNGAHKQSTVTDLAEQHGLDEDLGLPKLSPASAYRRAVNDAVKGGRRDERRFAAVKIEETELKIVHAIVRRDIVDAAGGSLSPKDASFETECKVGFDKEAYKDGKDADEMLKLSDETHPIAQKVKAQYEDLCVRYLPGDIRVAFQRAFERWGAIRLLEHGGLWWVPSPNADRVRAWKEFMSALGNSTVIIPVFDTEETINSLITASEETLEARLDGLMEQLQSFCSKGNTRVSTLEKRVEMFDDLRDQIELHARVLGNKQDELMKRLNDAHKGLVASLAVVEEAKNN